MRVRLVFATLLLLLSVSVSGVRSEDAGKGQSKSAEPKSIAKASSRYHFTEDWGTSAFSPDWAKALQHLKNKPGVHGLEIGSFQGRSTLWFLENILTAPDARITTIDIFVPSYHYEEVFDANMRVYGKPGKVRKLKGSSQKILRTLPFNSFDFVYVDGSHYSADVLSDAVLSWPLLKTGAIIIFDDYLWHKDDPEITRPQMAIDAFMKHFMPHLKVLHKGYQSDPSKGERLRRSFIITVLLDCR